MEMGVRRAEATRRWVSVGRWASRPAGPTLLPNGPAATSLLHTNAACSRESSSVEPTHAGPCLQSKRQLGDASTSFHIPGRGGPEKARSEPYKTNDRGRNRSGMP